MSLDTLPPRQRPVRQVATPRDRGAERGLPSRSLLVALLLACLTLMVVDRAGGDDSPVQPVRRVVGEVLGPAQAATSTVLGPIAGLRGALRTNDALREQLAEVERRNAELEQQLRTSGYDANRLAELEALRAIAGDTGYALVPARVVGIGAAQSFSSTITIDAGADAGLHPDMTVVSGAGLVGRVIEVTGHTATVLLIADPDSTVGGRIGDNMEAGFVDGRGTIGAGQPLELELVDRNVVPEKGQEVVTWGSEGGAPYVAGVPIGEVSRVFEDLRAGTYRAEIDPYVDFTALNMVGVVVPSGEGVIEVDGSLRER